MNKKKILVSALVMFGIISIITFASTLYPNALVSFEGIDIVKNSETSTTQGFIDINLKNINATGISFCLNYDTNYIELSTVDRNEPVKNPPPVISGMTNSFYTEHKFFEQNTAVFPDGVFQDNAQLVQGFPITANIPSVLGIADQDEGKRQGYLVMNFSPQNNAKDLCPAYMDNIQINDDVSYPAIMAKDRGNNGCLKLGRISFKIKDPAAFSKLTDAELKDVIKIVPFDDMFKPQSTPAPGSTPVPSSTPVPGSTPAPAGIKLTYVDENNDVKFYGDADANIDYDFDINVRLMDIQPQIKEITVSSYDIYKDGTVQDLVDFLNDRMSMLTLYYTDDSQAPATFQWVRNNDIDNISWDPKGGTYTITQMYNRDNRDFNISVVVNVQPIELLDFDFENKDITYLFGSANFPQKVRDLNLPETVRAVLDTYIPNGGVPEIDIDRYSYSTSQLLLDADVPAAFNSGNPGTFEIIGQLDMSVSDLTANYPWLTINTLPDIKMYRHVVTSASDLPKELKVVSAVTNTNGVLTIELENTDGRTIPDNTVFRIKMPGGEVIDTASMGTRYTSTISGGAATIVLAPDINFTTEKKLAQLINLGDRAGSFSIASTEPGKHTGPDTDFAPAPRRNIYLKSDRLDGNYEFDYSTSLSLMFQVKAGSSLPTTVTLPIESDRINTTYSGYDGTVQGHLKTFTVDSWTVDSGDPTTAGNVVTVTGTLKNTSYTNYGDVVNDDNVKVTIKYYVAENDGADSIDTIPNFIYNRQQVGYDYDRLQTKSFTVHNNGPTSIHGLSAVISLSDNNNKEAFVMTKELRPLLASGESIDFDITTKIGLPVGRYRSTVSILSNNNVLKTFTIEFEVTLAPVYDITLTADPSALGSAKTGNNQYTAEAGETITITAEPEIECEFVEWEVVSGGVTLASLTSATTTFTMPNNDVEIKAKFRETLEAKLRLEELLVKDTNDNNQTLYKDKDDWQTVTFDPVKRVYAVVVPNDTDKVKLWFKPRAEAANATFAISQERDPAPTVTPTPTPMPTITPVQDTTDNYYKSDEMELEVSPVDNIITLSITYDDPNDNPDRGDVTTTYKIHVFRKLKNSDLMTFNPGNSPYGLIMRDSSITNKNDAKQAFENNGNKFTSGNTPAGGQQDVPYLDKAWNGVNYDKDDSALFVIQSSPFEDPGYSAVKNSIGGAVSSVSKSVQVNLLSEPNTALQNGSSNDFTYITSSAINLPNTGSITELMNKRIRPDKYELTYSFTDFDGTTVSVSKPLIVLTSLGDVNVDYTADATDVSRVLHRFSTNLADNHNVSGYSDGGLLFKYRVCDTNKDGNVNAIDANYIRASALVPFYTNLSGGGT